MTHEVTDRDEAIVMQFRRGDALAMDRLYAAHAGYLAGVCARYMAHEDDVKDVLQESFIKIYTRMEQFSYRGPGSLRAWMARIVVNECIQALRHRSRQPSLLDETALPDCPDDTPDTDGLDMAVLTQLMAKMPEGYRMVLNLYAVEGLSHKEIARMLGIKPDSSASQFHRAKNMLAHLINAYKRSKQ